MGVLYQRAYSSHCICSSRVKMEVFRAKKESLDKEESRRTLVALRSTRSAKNVTFAKSADSLMPRTGSYQALCVGEEVVVREVWVKQAQLLIQQVKLCPRRKGGRGGRGEREELLMLVVYP